VAQRIAVGQPAPDFVSTDLTTKESARLRKFQGQPILLVFYSPTSKFVEPILGFAQSLRGNGQEPAITVLGLAISEDTDRILKQRKDLHLTFPILSGQGLRLTYAVDATPKFVVLDNAGIVRCAYVGWGKEMPDILTEELEHWKQMAHRR